MARNASSKQSALYQANVSMMILCGLTVFWVLTSPLVPYVFDVTKATGMTLFLTLQLIFTALSGAIGVWLNTLAARDVHITAQSLRTSLRRRR